jgi:site-specific recombinase XerD
MRRQVKPNNLSVYRRHQKECPVKKARDLDHCECPLWVHGRLRGRLYRRSLDTRSPEVAFAAKRRLENEGPDEGPKSPDPGPQDKLHLIKSEGGDKPLAEGSELFLSDIESGTVKSSRDKYRSVLTHFRLWAATHGIETVGQITKETVKSYLQQHDGVWKSVNTRRDKRTILRIFFNHAKEEDWINENPAASRKLSVQGSALEGKPFSDEESAHILAAIERLPEEERVEARALILLMFGCGMRISDATFCERASINRNGYISYVQIKARRRPKLPVKLAQGVIDALAALPASGSENWQGYFFLPNRADDYREARLLLARGERGFAQMIGQEFYDHELRRTSGLVEKVLELAGLHTSAWEKRKKRRLGEYVDREGCCHRFRDTFAVRMLLQTENIQMVSHMLGHKNIAITEKHYMSFLETHKHQLAEKAGALDYGFAAAV